MKNKSNTVTVASLRVGDLAHIAALDEIYMITQVPNRKMVEGMRDKRSDNSVSYPYCIIDRQGIFDVVYLRLNSPVTLISRKVKEGE